MRDTLMLATTLEYSMKNVYYFIDESGTIDGDSNLFILGCYKTDNPDQLREKLNELQESILNDPYFAFERKKFKDQGFHATENHFDIRARFYSLISGLNIRAYILLLNKKSIFFTELIKDKSKEEVYMSCIEKLLSDRLIKNRKSHNVFVFENFGNKPNLWKETIDKSVKNVLGKLDERGFSNIQYSIEIADKSEILLSIIDYVNYLYDQIFNKKPLQRTIENYKIIEPKIALTYKMDKDQFFDKNKRINLEKY